MSDENGGVQIKFDAPTEDTLNHKQNLRFPFVALSIKVKSEFYPEQVLKKSEFYRPAGPSVRSGTGPADGPDGEVPKMGGLGEYQEKLHCGAVFGYPASSGPGRFFVLLLQLKCPARYPLTTNTPDNRSRRASMATRIFFSFAAF